MDKNLESLKAVIRKGFEKADSRNEYTNEPRPYFESQISAIAECLQEENYRKADDLLDEIAGLTGKCEALQKDNENLMSTIEESREGEKPKTRENEFYEPIWEEINEKHVVVEQYWKVKCPCCGDTLCGSSFKDRLEEDIPNYCPHCGARLKEVKDETPKD